jgi:hypothetical protein
MSEKKAARRAARRSRTEAAELLKEYEASGLSREGFCAQRGMGISTLVRYFRWRAEDAGAGKRRWVSVEVSAKDRPAADGDGKLSVTLANGRRIEVSGGFDVAMLEQLLGVLERV